MADDNPDIQRDHWTSFGAWVKEERERQGLQKSAMARKSDPPFSASWLSTIENGGRLTDGVWKLPSPERSKLTGLANALGKAPEELIARAAGTFVESPSLVISHDGTPGTTKLSLDALLLGEVVELLIDVALHAADPAARERAKRGLFGLQEAIRRLPPELRLDPGRLPS